MPATLVLADDLVSAPQKQLARQGRKVNLEEIVIVGKTGEGSLASFVSTFPEGEFRLRAYNFTLRAKSDGLTPGQIVHAFKLPEHLVSDYFYGKNSTAVKG